MNKDSQILKIEKSRNLAGFCVSGAILYAG